VIGFGDFARSIENEFVHFGQHLYESDKRTEIQMRVVAEYFLPAFVLDHAGGDVAQAVLDRDVQR
jgi:hypothetical protein